jgi:dihydroneopterin aldolase
MLKSILEINKLILPIHIGVSSSERAKAQDIEFNITIEFASILKACDTDLIDDAICYEKMVNSIKAFCLGKEFHLIEHLAYANHQYLQNLFPIDKLKLQVCKKPPIKEIHANCCFTIVDTW